MLLFNCPILFNNPLYVLQFFFIVKNYNVYNFFYQAPNDLENIRKGIMKKWFWNYLLIIISCSYIINTAIIRANIDSGIKNKQTSSINNYTLLQSTDVEVYYLPNKHSLGHNFPNPFNSITTINYQIPYQNISEMNQFGVYDILGYGGVATRRSNMQTTI